jgi:hypothetical protein
MHLPTCLSHFGLGGYLPSTFGTYDTYLALEIIQNHLKGVFYIFLCSETLEAPSSQRPRHSWAILHAYGLVMPCHILFHREFSHIITFEACVTLLKELSTLEVALLDCLSIYLARVDYFHPPRLVGGGYHDFGRRLHVRSLGAIFGEPSHRGASHMPRVSNFPLFFIVVGLFVGINLQWRGILR